MDTPWLTVDQFCERYHFNTKHAKVHVHAMAREGRIPGAVKRNRHWYFHQEKTDKWDENPRKRR